MTLKKREFTPESGSVDTYEIPNSGPPMVIANMATTVAPPCGRGGLDK